MTKIKSEFEFELSQEITYPENGEFVYCRKLLLKAPSNKQGRITAKLKQGLMQAIASIQNNEIPDDSTKDESSDVEMKGDEVVAMLYMSKIDIS